MYQTRPDDLATIIGLLNNTFISLRNDDPCTHL